MPMNLNDFKDDWQLFSEATLALRRDTPTAQELAALEQDFLAILESGTQPRRHYHSIDHYRDVATSPMSVDEMNAHCSNLQEALHTHRLMEHFSMVAHCITRAGWHHDVVYTQIDEGIHPSIQHVLAPYYRQQHDVYTVNADPSVPPFQRELYELVLTVFGLHPGQALSPHHGQNEFLSALYGGLYGLEVGMPLKYILAEITMIEATIPFRVASHCSALRERVIKANDRLHADGLSDGEIDALMLGAVFMANHDVIGFRKPFEQFNRGGHQLLMEAAPTLQTTRGMFTACLRLADFLSRVGKEEEGGIASVFQSYQNFPSEEKRREWDQTALTNCSVQQERMRSYAATARLVAAVAGLQEGEADDRTHFTDLLTDATLEPPDHIFPRAMHEIRMHLTPDDQAMLLGGVEAGNFVDFTPDSDALLIASLRPELIQRVREHLNPTLPSKTTLTKNRS